MVSASLVLYKTPDEQIESILTCLKHSDRRPHLYIIDNSPQPRRRLVFEEPWITYITSKNLGYGGGHNIALRKVLDSSKFHFVLNPDLQFGPAELSKLLSFAESDANIGLVMPKVVFPDGTLQYLCKLIPTPLDLLIRRFPVPLLHRLLKDRMERFELRFSGYDHVMDIPVLSGCFMLLRTSALREVGMFDERFFMYLEDFDLSRRIHAQFRTVYYPGAVIVHDHAKYSFQSWRGLWMHSRSAIKYFNKWGWVFDSFRTTANRRALERIASQPKGATVPSPQCATDRQEELVARRVQLEL